MELNVPELVGILQVNEHKDNKMTRNSTILKYKSKGKVKTEIGSIIHFDLIETTTNRPRVPVTCVCGKKFEVSSTKSTYKNFTGLCSSCSIAYPKWKENKLKPTSFIDRYEYTSIDKNDLCAPMVNFRSDSPFSLAKIAVHRKNMAENIGRPLLSEEHVHHIDGNKLNNSIDNLLLVDPRQHNAITKMESFYEDKIKSLENEIERLNLLLNL